MTWFIPHGRLLRQVGAVTRLSPEKTEAREAELGAGLLSDGCAPGAQVAGLQLLVHTPLRPQAGLYLCPRPAAQV